MRHSPDSSRAARAAVAVLAAIAGLAPVAGCASSKQVQAEKRPDLRPKRSAADIRHPVVAVRKIARESGETIGYLKVNEDPGDEKFKQPVRVYWVYDPFFKVLGFYTETGDTYRTLREGGFASVGKHDFDDAKRLLLKVKPEQKIQLLDMDSPRTLETDREAAEKAKAAGAAAAKKDGAAPEGAKPAGEGSSGEAP